MPDDGVEGVQHQGVSDDQVTIFYDPNCGGEGQAAAWVISVCGPPDETAAEDRQGGSCCGAAFYVRLRRAPNPAGHRHSPSRHRHNKVGAAAKLIDDEKSRRRWIKFGMAAGAIPLLALSILCTQNKR